MLDPQYIHARRRLQQRLRNWQGVAITAIALVIFLLCYIIGQAG